jgi:antitoxin component YwqK of YwqJK toxin-antitoxin module
MRSLSIFAIISIFGISSCSSEKKSEEKKESENEKTELKDPELQNMMNHLNEDSEEILEDGFHEIKYPNGKLKSSGTIANGKKYGLWTHYREDGSKWSECDFENGEAHGKVVSYHPNGQVNYIGYFTGGEKSGSWMFYDMEGKLVKEVDMSEKLSTQNK